MYFWKIVAIWSNLSPLVTKARHWAQYDLPAFQFLSDSSLSVQLLVTNLDGMSQLHDTIAQVVDICQQGSLLTFKFLELAPAITKNQWTFCTPGEVLKPMYKTFELFKWTWHVTQKGIDLPTHIYFRTSMFESFQNSSIGKLFLSVSKFSIFWFL